MKSRMKKMANAEYAGLGDSLNRYTGYIGFGSTIQRVKDLTAEAIRRFQFKLPKACETRN
jgi:hypothetical protein